MLYGHDGVGVGDGDDVKHLRTAIEEVSILHYIRINDTVPPIFLLLMLHNTFTHIDSHSSLQLIMTFQ